MNASDIARAVEGQLEGGADPDITGAAPLDRAGPTDVSFLTSPLYAAEAADTAAGAVLVSSELSSRLRPDQPRIVVRDPHRSMAVLLPLLYPQERPAPGVDARAVVGDGVVLGAGVSIGAYAVIGSGTSIGDGAVVGPNSVIGSRCRIGPGAYLHAHVTVYDRVEIGARSVLHSGVRVGVDGFGYSSSASGHVRIPHVGRCLIGDDVEIGANTTVDRGSIGDTIIGNGCKIDNLVQVGHNVRMGEHCIVVSQVGISGSTRMGRFVTLGGQAGIKGHLSIGDGATVAAQAGVFGDIPAGATYSGYPARPHKEALRAQAGLFRLADVMKRLRALERAVLGMDRSER